MDKDLILKEKVAHSGIWDFSALYSYAHSWFIEEGYGVVEEKYSEKVSGNKKDIYIEWSCKKEFSDYFNIEFTLKFFINGLSDVEVEIDGEKKDMNKGSILIEIKGVLIKDPTSKWDTTVLYKFMRDVYNKYVVPARVEALENKTVADVQTFKDEIKAFLELSGKR